MKDLEAAFHRELVDTYHEAARAINYRPTYFLQMINELGGVAAARRLLEKKEISEGFTKLWENGRLDLSVEALVLKPEYAPLFTDAERAVARRRLAEVNYVPPWVASGEANGGPATAHDENASPSGVIEHASRASILSAMERFDREMRGKGEWDGWEQRKTYKYAIEHKGRLYPTKKIVSLATGLPRTAFFKSREARALVERHGLKVISLEDRRNTQDDPVGSPADATHVVLSGMPGTALSLDEILARAQGQGLLDRQVTQSTLYDELHRDSRFVLLGNNLWALADQLPEAVVRAGPTARFWRIHFPRELWNEARQNNVIAVGFIENPKAMGVKQFKRIKVGDRVIAYLQRGVIGSVGIVTEPYREDGFSVGADAELFGGKYPRRIRVIWADDPAEPVDLRDQLTNATFTKLYNKLKNPNTVMPLTREDYVTVLTLLGVDDPDGASDETRLPAAWPRLTSFRDFCLSLEPRPYDASELHALAIGFGADFDDSVDEETLAQELQQFRLLAGNSDGGYQPQPHVSGSPAALLRLMALAILVPVEGSAEIYELPARAILSRLREAGMPQPISEFAPTLGKDGEKLLGWYAEAGLVSLAGSEWQWTDDAFQPLHGDDAATKAYNEFLETLLADIDGSLEADLPHVGDEPLPHVRDLDDRLRKLGEKLLIDSRVVYRIYRSLIAGRHVVLSGPPGTGKTKLAKRLPPLLWSEEPRTFKRLTSDLDKPPVEHVTEQRHGYAVNVVTATEDWGVRDVIGGIAPRLDSSTGKISYAIQYGVLTQTILKHFEGTEDGRSLPPRPRSPIRRDYRDKQGKRYRGVWLVIDEFTRAPVDAAFGSLLTTLSGGNSATLAVPAEDFSAVMLPLPADFRIIGTLNSFDRHFLNQMSEALKRRFDFIDVPPPLPAYAEYEQGIAIKQALHRLRESGFQKQISVTDHEPAAYRWAEGVATEPIVVDGLWRYTFRAENPEIEAVLRSFWHLFEAIRVFR